MLKLFSSVGLLSYDTTYIYKFRRLDVITNEILKDALRFSGKVGVIASEEEDNPMAVKDKYRDVGLKTTSFNNDIIIDQTGDKYIAVFDPLDGSSNVDAGIPTGTIFGIFEEDPLAVSHFYFV